MQPVSQIYEHFEAETDGIIKTTIVMILYSNGTFSSQWQVSAAGMQLHI